MDLFEAMRTTFAAREFSDEPVPDAALVEILENARFAPSGGNRQGWRVIAVREPATKDALAALAEPAAKRYIAQLMAGENPWNSVVPSAVSAETIAATPAADRMLDPIRRAPVVLVVAVDLRVVASLDSQLARIGVTSGASVYPFAWNILLAARALGYGGVFSTLAIAEEPRVQALLGMPPEIAVAALIPLGRPAQRITKLKRKPVAEFAFRERWNGAPLA
jgi:nitroreductase